MTSCLSCALLLLPPSCFKCKVYWVVLSSPCALPLCLPAVVEQLVALDAAVFVECAARIPHNCWLLSRHLALLSPLSCALLLVPLPPLLGYGEATAGTPKLRAESRK